MTLIHMFAFFVQIKLILQEIFLITCFETEKGGNLLMAYYKMLSLLSTHPPSHFPSPFPFPLWVDLSADGNKNIWV